MSETHCVFCNGKIPPELDVCRDHLALVQGFSGVEEHHIEGRRNSRDVVIQPVSIHAVFNSKMNRWPESLRTPSKNPLLKIARHLQVMRDSAAWFLSATDRDVDWLIALGLTMERKHGSEWWREKRIADLDVGGES